MDTHQAKRNINMSHRGGLPATLPESVFRKSHLLSSLTNKFHSPATPNTVCHIFRLPAELRLESYSYVLGGKYILTRDDPINKPTTTPSKIDQWTQYATFILPLALVPANRFRQGDYRAYENDAKRIHPSHKLALLKVCRQISTESCLLPFSLNIFKFSGVHALDTWMEKMGPQVVSTMRTIRVCTIDGSQYSFSSTDRFVQRIWEFIELRRVEVDVLRSGLQCVKTANKTLETLDEKLKDLAGRNLEVSFYKT